MCVQETDSSHCVFRLELSLGLSVEYRVPQASESRSRVFEKSKALSEYSVTEVKGQAIPTPNKITYDAIINLSGKRM